ncbi:MAG: hypothetical protein AB1896_12700 [Thermodesulfobacteriota bacterium]
MKKGQIVLIALVAAVLVYFGLIRTSELRLETPDRVYWLKVPRTYLKTNTQTQTQNSPWGPMLITIKSAESFFGNHGLVLSHFAMPEGSEAGRSEEQILRDGLEGAAGGMKGKISEPEELDFAGNLGMEATYQGKYEGTPVYGIIRAFIIDRDIIFLMSVDTDEEDGTSQRMIDYLDTIDYESK